jgi:pentatricopeptide repeat protein
MNSVALFGMRVVHKFLCFPSVLRRLCDYSFDGGDNNDNGFQYVEEPLKRMYKSSDFDSFQSESCVEEEHFSVRRSYVECTRIDADRVLDILRRDGPGFDAKRALSELEIKVSWLLVREVFTGILRNINEENKTRCAKLGFKFFMWSDQQGNYKHTGNSYHLLMKIFAECEEFRAMWKLADEMVEKGFHTTAQTFNILICTCGEAGLAMNVVERFIRSKTFNFRPYKNSYNAILHSLLVLHQYKLIEWVYQHMLEERHSPDVLTYNVILYAKCRLGKAPEFHRLLDEMLSCGIFPDFHTYNILLHVYGKTNNPVAALDLLNAMKEASIDPTVLHYTTLIDGLGRAGNLLGCQYFFDEMIKAGCIPDVVCYTVMITGYIMNGELEKAQEMFEDMIVNGQLPNVFTYNSMIRGLCMAGKFEEACSMLKEMESRGCNPNFHVYRTLVRNLRNAGKLSEAHEVIKQMIEKSQYSHLVTKIKRYKR